jgi:hypothetical protein
MPLPYGLPTKVVTLVPATVAEKLPPATAMAVCEARSALDEVTQGVTLLGGELPNTENDALVEALFVLITTMTVVRSGAF